jgi:hypothetical protein
MIQVYNYVTKKYTNYLEEREEIVYLIKNVLWKEINMLEN